MSENLWFSDVFRGCRNVTLGEYGLKGNLLRNTFARHKHLEYVLVIRWKIKNFQTDLFLLAFLIIFRPTFFVLNFGRLFNHEKFVIKYFSNRWLKLVTCLRKLLQSMYMVLQLQRSDWYYLFSVTDLKCYFIISEWWSGNSRCGVLSFLQLAGRLFP